MLVVAPQRWTRTVGIITSRRVGPEVKCHVIGRDVATHSLKTSVVGQAHPELAQTKGIDSKEDKGATVTNTGLLPRNIELLCEHVKSTVGSPEGSWPGGYPGHVELALIDAVLSIRARYGNSPDTGVRAGVRRTGTGSRTPPTTWGDWRPTRRWGSCSLVSGYRAVCRRSTVSKKPPAG